ncbi:MAG: hypothetical protein II013_04935 [Lachnobacterium sp.]|nr:hypothetical protein [Lachnobacterium sp.]
MYAINQKKVQQEIINNMFKKNKGDYTRVDKDSSVFTYVLINTHSIFKLFKDDCYIVENNKKFKKAIEDMFDSFGKERVNYKEAQLSNTIMVKNGLKINTLETVDGLKVYFDNDMLKYFEKKEVGNISWFVKSPKEPIFVEFANEVICAILPIYLKDN